MGFLENLKAVQDAKKKKKEPAVPVTQMSVSMPTLKGAQSVPKTIQSPAPAPQSSASANSAMLGKPKPQLRTMTKQAATIPQSIARSYAAAGATVLEGKGAQVNPKDKGSQILFGTKKPFTLAQEQPFVSPESKYAAPIAAAFIAPDAIPGGRPIKNAITKGASKLKSLLESAVGIKSATNAPSVASKLPTAPSPSTAGAPRPLAPQGEMDSMLRTPASQGTPAPTPPKALENPTYAEASSPTQPDTPRPGPSARTSPESIPRTERKPQSPPPTLESAVSLSKKINPDKPAPGITLSRFEIDSESKGILREAVDQVRPKFEAAVGKPLTQKEILRRAEESSEFLSRAVSREQTEKYLAALKKTEQRVLAAARRGTFTEEELKTLVALETASTDAGRRLNALKSSASPKDASLAEQMISEMAKVREITDDIIKDAAGVDFNDFEQASRFYRRHVAPTVEEFVDTLRYNSMLSSPLTHTLNVMANAINSAFIAPVEKAAIGAVDFIGSGLTGADRTAYAGESVEYMKEYYGALGTAFKNFSKALSGKVETTNLDLKRIPLFTEGKAKTVEDTLSVPSRFLEAEDQFFLALVRAGENAALKYRAAKGVPIADVADQASQAANYRLFRQELFPEGQGGVLNTVDHVTSLLFQLRSSPSPFLRTLAKWTLPFIKTPMNIFKQGLEYSPLGYFSLMSGINKPAIIARASIGSAAIAGTLALLGSGRITAGEPPKRADKNAFRDAGKLPWSVKLGDTWVSFQKLPPQIAFTLAFTATLDEAIKAKKLDEGTAQMLVHAFAKYATFMSDQSYAKGVGDMLDAARGDEDAIERMISNPIQQFVPFRALTGWLARLSDQVQRNPDPDGTWIEKQVQLLMMQYPGLTEKAPARTNAAGDPVLAPNPVINAFSPFRSSTEDPDKAAEYEDILRINKLDQNASIERSILKETAHELHEEFQALPQAERSKRIHEIMRSNRPLGEAILDLKKQDGLDLTAKERELKNATVKSRAQFIYEETRGLSEADRRKKIRDYQQKTIITPDVMKDLQKLLRTQSADR